MAAATEIVQELKEETLLKYFEDDVEVLKMAPTKPQLEDLFAHKWFRYFVARLKESHNILVNNAFAAPPEAFPENKGKVLGIRVALGLLRLLYDEAVRREGREEEPEEIDGSDYDDFAAVAESSEKE